MAYEAEPVLRIEGVSKIYGNTCVLDDVDFEVPAGQVHPILGENGAGKSTLAKIIAGAIPPTSGSLTVGGERKYFRSPADSLRAGVVMVYQETSLIPTMTVAQNLQLGHEPWLIRFRSINNAAQHVLQSLNFNVDPRAVVEQLTTAQCQMVEIARAAHFNARVIIFDEPTASLSPVERQQFFELVDRLRERGVAIIFITHALEEALRVADRITVLRDGKRVTCGPVAEFDRPTLVRQMVGRDVSNTHYTRASTYAASKARGEKILSVESVAIKGTVVRNMSFALYGGEVVGVAGLVGSGRSEIAQIVAGVRKHDRPRSGMIYLRSKPVRYSTPAQAIRDGIVYITENRKKNGFFETMTADDNIYLAVLTSQRGWHFLYSRATRQRAADYWIKKLSITASHRNLHLNEYSGGNQQKVVLAKALAQEPDVIFFDEPTRGVDVGVIPQIHETIRALARQGKAVMVISSYLPEILSVSDRILVARRGRIVQELDAAAATEDKIMQAAVS
ncbi:MAG: sugar ABC transporter ATP-binding protein [Gammaproteobacteria bacterium]